MKKDGKYDLTPLFSALGAVAFFVFCIPVLDSIGFWVSNVFGLKSIKLNHEASQYATETEEENLPVQAVGFQVPSEEEEMIEDE